MTVPATSKTASPDATVRSGFAGRPGLAALSGSATRSFWDRRAVRIVGGIVVPLVILGIWQAVTVSGLIPPYRLPAAIVGLTKAGDVLLSPILAAFRAIPSLALVPLLLLWMGIGEDSKVTLIAIGAFFPVFTTVSVALRQVDPHSVEMARSFSLRGFALFRTVQLPSVVPSIMAGLRLALAQSWLFLVAAELIAASMGLGWLLTDSQSTGRVDRILLAIVLLALLGTLTNGILSLVQKYLLRRWI